MNIEKRLKEINDRKLEIRSQLESNSEVDFETVKAELEALEVEARGIADKKALAASIAAGKIDAEVIEKPEGEKRMKDFNVMSRDEVLESPEYRSAYLKMLQGKLLTEVEKRAATTSSAAAAVPTQTMNMIIDKLRQTNVLFNRVTVSYVPGNLKFVVANAKNAAAWKTEGSDGATADDTVTSITLTGYELIKLAEVSAAAQAMTIDAFEAYIVGEIGRQMSIAIENAILNGDGSGEPTGILTGVTFDTSNSVSYTTAVDYDDIVDGLGKLPTMYHQGAIFVMSRATLFGGIRKVKDAEGNPIFAYNPQDKAAMTLLGYPVVIDDYIADDVILLGDFSYYYMNFAKPVEIASDSSVGFKSGKITYRGLAVADGKPALSETFVKIYKA